MTEQEKIDLELSLSMIDQKTSSDDVTKANKDLVTAVNMEVDSSLDLTDSKDKSKKAVDTETTVINKSVDIIDDINYTRSETARVEKRYLNILDRRAEVESKIGLVDYSKIDKALHDKIVRELETRLKTEQEQNKQEDADFKEETAIEDKRKKSEKDYRKEAEKYHKKRIGVFKKIQGAHKNYMDNTSSFTGKLMMGAVGKGTSELTNLVDSLTDMVPGAKTAKRVGGFVKDKWDESREIKRQNRIDSTAKMLRERDVAPVSESEAKNQKSRDDQQKRGTSGILDIGFKLEKIFVFLKKLGESLMLMGLLKGLAGFMGSAISGLAGMIGNALMFALKGAGIIGLLGGILDAITSGLAALAAKLGFSLPGKRPRGGPDIDRSTRDDPVPADRDKEGKKKPKREKKPKGKLKKGLKGFGMGAILAAGASFLFGDKLDEVDPTGKLSDAATAALLIPSAPVAAGAAALMPGTAGESQEDVDALHEDRGGDEWQKKIAEYNKTHKETKSKTDTKTKEVEKTADKFKMVNSSTVSDEKIKDVKEVEKAKIELEKTKQQQTKNHANVIATNQNNSTTNINQTKTSGSKQFSFNPYEYNSKPNHSRGEIK